MGGKEEDEGKRKGGRRGKVIWTHNVQSCS